METAGKSLAAAAAQILDSLLNLFYPETCFICSAPISHRRDYGLCRKCLDNAYAFRVRPPVCLSCGLPLPNFNSASDLLCGACILQPPEFSGARSFGYYRGNLKRLIQELKFHNRPNLVRHLGPMLVDTFYATWDRGDFDLVVPIPLHFKRRYNRGYNQSELLARFLARRTGVPLGRRILIRKGSARPQVGLSDKKRRENVRGVFHCIASAKISRRRVLLIDDVMTTGATVESASAALLKSGAMRVSVLTLARTE